MYVDETWDGTPEDAANIVNKFLMFNITAVYQIKWTALSKNPDRARFMERPRILVNTLQGAVAVFKDQRVVLDVDGVVTVSGWIDRTIAGEEIPGGGVPGGNGI